MEDTEDLETLLKAEFERQGLLLQPRTLAALTDALKAEDVEFGEIGVAAAVIGWRVAKQR